MKNKSDQTLLSGNKILSLQQQFAPNSICFGCGPANSKGLKINSFISDSKVIAEWTPESHHEAFPGMLNGGIIGSLLDCHCNWTAAWALMNKEHLSAPPCTVTANYKIDLRRPTPSKSPLKMRAWVESLSEDRAQIQGELSSGGKICATCHGLFVAVKKGHPAHHRWN